MVCLFVCLFICLFFWLITEKHVFKFSSVDGAYLLWKHAGWGLYQALLVLWIPCKPAEAVATGLHQLGKTPYSIATSGIRLHCLGNQEQQMNVVVACHESYMAYVDASWVPRSFYNLETSPSSFTQTLIPSCFSCLQYAYSKYHQLASWNGLGTGLLCYGWLASFPILVPQLLWLAVRSTLLRLQATIAVVCGLGMKPMV